MATATKLPESPEAEWYQVTHRKSPGQTRDQETITTWAPSEAGAKAAADEVAACIHPARVDQYKRPEAGRTSVDTSLDARPMCTKQQ